jgi:hypothetical protein
MELAQTEQRYREARVRERLRIVVGGFLGLTPAGGVTWDYLQWPLGFSMLGHDVVYVEDTRLWPIYQEKSPGNCTLNVAHVRSVMEAFGFATRWAYRDEASGQCFGLSVRQLKDFCRSADLFVNVSCSTYLRDEYRSIPVRALVDSDPMFTQIQYCTGASLTTTQAGMSDLFEGHTHHFTFGENICKTDCRIPDCGIEWRSIRQPICLSHWPNTLLHRPSNSMFTTLMNWSATRDLIFQGDTWGQKDVELMRFLELPKAARGIRLAIAVNQTTGTPFPAALFQEHGWTILDPLKCASNWSSYRKFLGASLGEFSVAKQTYVKARTGWFSCRSACYLALGRPVVTQDTGWTEYIPFGRGLMPFNDTHSAAEALQMIMAAPGEHSRAARHIAAEYFSSDRVLGTMLRQLKM